ncbi:hypothetical protein CAOG_06478 [Capsaspora owczarzaki ATCC 30864]|uniref:Uncharacterized protein n=1 Tax=Capsaspora owczarzaki (strain ATCC 30864) TaxID=595528 RepID=A0A0D2X4I3_CAPO3|nr:hypothetical protein CAOG_06478 [Capsaspora owczarzaki ATCC 30864]KJE96109.1 hypothetical protein CAOG_006478 [Capsaspora owczarzaki ATCC 30864]|eukprot:XP_004345227.1 hypothetical protein CAOG_06478 [Capsaspora owczarzaki ATCC 30864]
MVKRQPAKSSSSSSSAAAAAAGATPFAQAAASAASAASAAVGRSSSSGSPSSSSSASRVSRSSELLEPTRTSQTAARPGLSLLLSESSAMDVDDDDDDDDQDQDQDQDDDNEYEDDDDDDDDDDNEENDESDQESASAGAGLPEFPFPRRIPNFKNGDNSSLSSVLDRVANFLPQMKAANVQLERVIATQGQKAVDIETVDEEGAYVEMDLSCGIIEQQNELTAETMRVQPELPQSSPQITAKHRTNKPLIQEL